jgi:hypothetical protein
VEFVLEEPDLQYWRGYGKDASGIVSIYRTDTKILDWFW